MPSHLQRPGARRGDRGADRAGSAFARQRRWSTAAAPKLQRVLAEALETGGWFGEAHEGEIRKAAAPAAEEERLTALRTLLAEEARMGMMVGVAVGWALAEELRQTDQSNEED